MSYYYIINIYLLYLLYRYSNVLVFPRYKSHVKVTQNDLT